MGSTEATPEPELLASGPVLAAPLLAPEVLPLGPPADSPEVEVLPLPTWVPELAAMEPDVVPVEAVVSVPVEAVVSVPVEPVTFVVPLVPADAVPPEFALPAAVEPDVLPTDDPLAPVAPLELPCPGDAALEHAAATSNAAPAASHGRS